MLHIAFFGLGNMGAGMAANLLKAGYKVSVFDLVQAQVDKLCALGASAGDTPADTVKNADIIISMLPAGRHVEQLYFGTADATMGIVARARAGAIFIDCSTIEAQTARSMSSLLKERGHSFVDAPVSGGVAGAAAGTLTFIVGGSAQTVEAVNPVLQAMGKNIFHAGEAGAGQVAKICNNMLLAVLMAGTSEALQLAIDNGIDAAVMSDIMKKSSGNNWTLQTYNPCPGVMENVPSSNQYQGGFMVDLMNKDLGLAMATAATHQSAVPMGSLAQSLYQLHGMQGNGKKDFSSIFQAFRPKG
ncbi:3-hydroxyisobutyrate dehydrogenase [Glaciecola siphonariae]|uniref:3-hydroxyisobutyrate dehydrogenase n=1 Tax=Glaciecola siphonariae TaxID=521012 RepID=A0ABV9LT87_9ALTE